MIGELIFNYQVKNIRKERLIEEKSNNTWFYLPGADTGSDALHGRLRRGRASANHTNHASNTGDTGNSDNTNHASHTGNTTSGRAGGNWRQWRRNVHSA